MVLRNSEPSNQALFGSSKRQNEIMQIKFYPLYKTYLWLTHQWKITDDRFFLIYILLRGKLFLLYFQ